MKKSKVQTKLSRLIKEKPLEDYVSSFLENLKISEDGYGRISLEKPDIDRARGDG